LEIGLENQRQEDLCLGDASRETLAIKIVRKKALAAFVWSMCAVEANSLSLNLKATAEIAVSWVGLLDKQHMNTHTSV
jgi:hypothetical protein